MSRRTALTTGLLIAGLAALGFPLSANAERGTKGVRSPGDQPTIFMLTDC